MKCKNCLKEGGEFAFCPACGKTYCEKCAKERDLLCDCMAQMKFLS